MQAASTPNQTYFIVSGLSLNTQVYTAGVSLGYRISATVIRLYPCLKLRTDLPRRGLCWYVNWYTYIIYGASYVYNCSEFYIVRKSRLCRFKSDRYPLLGVVAQLAETTTKDVDVDELIGSNVDSIHLMYPLSYTYYSV